MIATVHSPRLTTKQANPKTCLVVALAESKLREGHYLALREVTCQFCEGVLILRGRVPSFYLKQVAQTVVRNIEEVAPIDNRLEVD